MKFVKKNCKCPKEAPVRVAHGDTVKRQKLSSKTRCKNKNNILRLEFEPIRDSLPKTFLVRVVRDHENRAGKTCMSWLTVRRDVIW